jgi:hypothetical protein
MSEFYFLRYDGCNFTLYEKHTRVSFHSYPVFMDGMRNGERIYFPLNAINYPIVTELLFSILLQGYISTLDAIPVEVRSNLQERGFGRNDVRFQH